MHSKYRKNFRGLSVHFSVRMGAIKSRGARACEIAPLDSVDAKHDSQSKLKRCLMRTGQLSGW
ncbi:hypothetical protein GN244_ATG12061 [Phytophthora infestans]|uniref:Uncharacterized protein n=1 Tax=Phytophthora infestans TaxID=4787 RepID=A0A833SMB1_PHYIN|nr:hypothetical protein GN244_ATG12061 [Phytophthora infestans]